MSEAVRLYGKSTCSKCVRAKALLEELGVPFQERDYAQIPLTPEDIREIAAGRSLTNFLNPTRDAYKAYGFDQEPPSEAAALAALLEENNLLYRPITIRGDRMVIGWNEGALRELVARG